MKLLSLFFIMLLLSACETDGVKSNAELAPQMGDKIAVPKRTPYLMIASAQISPSIKTVRGGVEFEVAVNESKQIIYISSSSPAFRTPEGLSLDSTLEQVLASGGDKVVYEPGWAHYSVLPSGWCAAFYGFASRGNGKVNYDPPDATTKVTYYFKRK